MTYGDYSVVGLLAALTGLLFAWQWGHNEPGSSVHIHVGDAAWGHFPLQDNRNIQVPGILGDSTLEIDNGKVRFLTSPCRNKVCLHSGWQSQSGHATACLPNRISIVIHGASSANGLDAETF